MDKAQLSIEWRKAAADDWQAGHIHSVLNATTVFVQNSHYSTALSLSDSLTVLADCLDSDISKHTLRISLVLSPIRQPTLHHTSSPPQPPPHLYSPRITLLIQGYSNRDIPSTWPTSKWLTQTLQPKRPSQRPLPKPPSLAQQKVVIPRRDLKSRRLVRREATWTDDVDAW